MFFVAGILFMFSGQGAQYPGMGRELYEQCAPARRVYDTAAAVLGRSLDALGLGGDADTLALTENSQPAIFTLSMAIFEALGAEGLRPDAVAGFSLGEVGALCAAGVMPLEQGLKVIDARARAMQKAAAAGDGAMFAVMGPPAADIERACEQTGGDVYPVNYNSPGQTVIAGELKACEAACERLKEQGQARITRLAVSAAFHTPMMRPAADELFAFLRRCDFAQPKVPVYSNLTGGAHAGELDTADYLRRQMTSPVRWEQAMRAAVLSGHELFLELGPGKTLCGLMRRIDRGAKALPCETPAQLRAALEACNGR